MKKNRPKKFPGTTSPSVSDGVYLMLAPLSLGKHNLHWKGTIDLNSVGWPKVY